MHCGSDTDNTFFGRYMISWHCVQTFNSVGQSPCVVAGYMMATCSGGCEPFTCLHVRGCGLIFIAAYTIDPLPSGYSYTGGYGSHSSECMCSTIGYSLFGACAVCQGQESLECDAITLCPFSIPSSSWIYPFLSWPTYATNCSFISPPSQ